MEVLLEPVTPAEELAVHWNLYTRPGCRVLAAMTKLALQLPNGATEDLSKSSGFPNVAEFNSCHL
jgi:hypothetical protein